MTGALLTTDGLGIAFGPADRPVRAVSDVDLAIRPGEIVGIAGESGSGKTTLCAALVRALPRTARVFGRILFEGRDLYALSPRELRALRRRDLAMVLQNPMTSLDPLFTIGDQLRELLRERGVTGDLDGVALEQLRRVHLTAPELRLRQYPHELSGGMKQRVLIAMATASAPRLLIADEPTSALDATVQEEILVLFREIRDRFGTAVVIVSHDLGAIRRVCDRTVVMYAGRIVEDGATARLFANPRHPYTSGLIASLPHLEDADIALSSIPGQVPDLAGLGPGCAFAPRCPRALPVCARERPGATAAGPEDRVFCFAAQAEAAA